MNGMDRALREATLAAGIRRVSGAEEVELDADGVHVYVGPINGEAVRYRLGVEAQHWLNGEYTADELQTVYLHPPG